MTNAEAQLPPKNERIHFMAGPECKVPEPKAATGQGLTADEMKKCHWVKPDVKVKVAFVEWTEGVKLRHSRFLSLA